MKLTRLLIGSQYLGILVLAAAPRELPANGYLVFEAESAANQAGFAPLTVMSDPLARGESYVILSPAGREPRTESPLPSGVDYKLPSAASEKSAASKAPSPHLEITFHAATKGTVFVWVRAKMPRGASEYLAFQLDGSALKTWWDHTVFPPLSRDRWVWHHADSYQIAAGPHTLTVARPMPGMGIDAIAVSANPAFCPKIAREGCIYLEADAQAPDRRGVFEFDAMGGQMITLWCKVRRGTTALGAVKCDGAALPASSAVPVTQGEWTWLPAGAVRAAGGAHRVEVPASPPVETIAICTKREFTPASDPYFTGAVTITPVAIKPDREFKLYRGYRFNQISGFTPPAHPVARSIYGGRTDRHGAKTGFFHMEKSDGRWTFVDPDGCFWFNLDVNHFGPDSRLRPKMIAKYSNETNWANAAADALRSYGFTSVGFHPTNNTPTYDLQLKQPLPYFVEGSFMMSFARSKGHPASAGNSGYPGGCIMPFDPDFPKFCAKRAHEITAKIKDDPFLIGYYLDNELAIPDDALSKLLALPGSDAGHQAAAKWLADRGRARDPSGRYSEKVLAEFFDYMLSTYLQTAIAAIRQYDSHHMICGIRANSPSDIHEQFLRTLGRYTDVVSINHYMRWTPDPTLMSHWLEWSGKPVIISEWYAKGMDTRFDNVKNAGWIVKTQRDRGSFYQNFALCLMQHPAIVGFNWFRVYDDNNNSANKGIFDDDFRPYQDLASAMAEVNVNAYELLDFFAHHSLDTSFAAKVY